VFERAKTFHALDLAATEISIRVINVIVFTIQFGYMRLFGENRGARIEGQMKSAGNNNKFDLRRQNELVRRWNPCLASEGIYDEKKPKLNHL
jgi:hypothetical protein